MNAEGQRGSLKRVGGRWVPSGDSAVMDAESSDGSDESSKPWKTATRAEWDEYAKSQGVDPEQYSSKDDLIDALK